MRKRKPPILPVTLLVALLAVVAYTNYQNSPLTKKEREQAPKVAESRPTEDKSAVSERLKASVAKDAPEDAPKPVSGNPLAPIAGPGSIPPQAMEQIEKMKKAKGIKDAPADPMMQKPTPNESATSSQWYRPETPK